MSPPRIPGFEDILRSLKIDSGTLVRNHSTPPGILKAVRSSKEGASRSMAIKRAQAYMNSEGLTMAEIYFAADDHEVHIDDKLAMNNLIKSVKKLTGDGFKIRLLCTGGADYRASVAYNEKLGLRRAKSVKSMFNHLNLSEEILEVLISSIGESQAQQPKRGKRPSLIKIMNDRKVEITIEDIFPPVTLSATGNNLLLNAIIEMNEINNGGTVVAPADCRNARAERDFQGIEHDPILPLVLINSHYLIKKTNNKDEAYIECNVVERLTNELLFTVSSTTKGSRSQKEYFSEKTNPYSNPKIKRLYSKKGILTGVRIVTGVHERAYLLFDNIYKNLKGGYNNITERIKNQLLPL